MDKQLISSMTIQGAVVMLLVKAADYYQLQVGSEEITGALSAAIFLAGFVATVIGRIRASRNLKIGSKLL